VQLVKTFLESWLSKHNSKELKTNCTWLKLLVVELSVLHGFFGKDKEQRGTKNFLKARVEKKANKHPWL